MYVDDITLAGKKQNINPTWQILMKDVDLGEPTSFLDHMRIVNTTPQMTCFRGARVCTKWLQEKVAIKSYSLTTSWNWEQVTK